MSVLVKLKKKRIRNVIGALHTIDDIKKEKKALYKKPKRNLPNICIIDDNEFSVLPTISALNKEGYVNIKHYHDYTNNEDFSKFDVILCDIDGIGINHHEKEQGVAIAKDLLKNYPLKKIFLYSGHTYKMYSNDLPPEIKQIMKQSPPMEVANILDDACSYLWNPISAWKFIENVLKSENISHKNMAYIEHVFVSSILDEYNYFESDSDYLESIIKVVSILEFVAKIVLGIIELVSQK